MRMPLRICTPICVAVLAVAAQPAHAADLIGISSSTLGELYDIDTSTGAATSFLVLNERPSFSGITFFQGELYVTDIVCGVLCFGKIDLGTGIVTILSQQDGSFNWWGLTTNEAAGVMYTVDSDAGSILKEVAADGSTTTIGPTDLPGQGSGLAYDEADGVLYAVAFDGNVYTLDTGNGASTLVGPTGLGPFVDVHQGLANDPDTGILYMNEADTFDSLYTIDKATGAATLVGANGPVSGFGIDGLTFEPGPPCPWDCNVGGGDGIVGISDFLLLLAQWGGPGTCDIDGRGVGITDFLALLAHWGPCP